MKKIKIHIETDPDKGCIGCGACLTFGVEDVLEMGNDGLIQVREAYKDKVISDPELIEMLKMAKDSCPNSAIEITNIED